MRQEQAESAVPYVHHPCFAFRKTGDRLWGRGRRRISVTPYELLPVVQEGAAAPLAKRDALSEDDERTLFMQYNYAKYRLNRLLTGKARCPAARRPRRIALWRGRVEQVCSTLADANLALVLSMARRVRAYAVEFEELICEGHMTLLRCIEKFDVSRGFRFSTYACRALLACFHRMETRERARCQRFPLTFGTDTEPDDAMAVVREDQREQAIDAVQAVLRDNTADLDEAEAVIVRGRFPMDGTRRRRSLAQLGRSLGISGERARSIEASALRKLALALDDQLAA